MDFPEEGFLEIRSKIGKKRVPKIHVEHAGLGTLNPISALLQLIECGKRPDYV
jgi:hypothetical protein